MDILKQLGELALGSRLKRLSDQIMKDGTEVYKANNIDFEPRWFPVYYTLTQRDNLGIMEIANEIGVKHPTVSQTVKELEKAGYANSIASKTDGRKRLVVLSDKGKRLLPRIELVWKDISNVLHQLNAEHTQNILCAIDDFEDDLNQKNMLQRVHEVTKERLMNEVEIVEFKPSDSSVFKQLNEEWITKYFTLEEEDIHILTNPIDTIVNPGGAILLAKIGQETVGTCALIKTDQNDEFELAKMAVTEKYRGRQIGKKLGLSILKKAKTIGAKKVVLESNKKLTPAITLYERLGFKLSRKSLDTSVYERCDITMEIILD